LEKHFEVDAVEKHTATELVLMQVSGKKRLLGKDDVVI
jgi:hypothetical protein